MVAANTFYQHAGPTFFPLTAVGRPKTLDYLCVPAGHLPAIEKCCALWKQGRRLQLINSAERKDHIPLLLVLQYELRFDKTIRERTSWDYNLLAQALQRGRGREEFLSSLDARCVGLSVSSAIDAVNVDQHWHVVSEKLQAVAKEHFGKGSTAVDQDLRARRKVVHELLSQRADLRERLAKGHGDLGLLTVTHWRLREATKGLKLHLRAEKLKSNQALEVDIKEAWAARRFHELERLCRWRAGTGIGPKKRHSSQVTGSRPSCAEWAKHLQQAGHKGGLSAVHFNYHGFQSDRVSAHEVLAPRTHTIVSQADEDVWHVVHHMKRAAKRKSAPEWSVPMEVILMCLAPSYHSVRAPQTTGLGYLRQTEFPYLMQTLRELFVHVRRCSALPVIAHRSQACPIPKGLVGKRQGPEALRLIHVMCPLWSNWVRAALARGPTRIWPDSFHGFLQHRRREGAMLVTRITQWRCRQLQWDSVMCFHDLANAFGSTCQEWLEQAAK
eukprot:6492533-Amphidinium_carterae.1